MEYYLRADTKEELLEDLRNAGFEWYDYDEEGGERTVRDPKKNEVISVRGHGACIYLEHLVETPPIYDEDGETLLEEAVFTTTFHANCKMRNPHTFSTDLGTPNNPKYGWQ